MKNQTIHENATLLDALNKINGFEKNASLTLFIVDDDYRVVGTLTDGDVRRSLVNGGTLSVSVGNVANRSFSYLRDGDYDVRQIHRAKEKGIELLPVLDEGMHIVDVVNLNKHKSYLPIDAVLMAGGKGERLRPLTEKTPKPLLKVGDKCIIDHNIDRLIEFGVRNISVTVNYLKEQIEEHFAEPRGNVKINIVREPEFLGTIGSVRFVEKFCNDTILLMNSDIFTNINYEDFYLHFKEYDADMSIAAVPYPISIPYGIFELDGCKITGVVEKPTYNYYANAGIYLIKKELLELIPDGKFFNATDFMEMLLKRNCNVIRFPLNGTWIDIGNPQEYQKANELVKHL